jgi:hypothetical protein
MALRSLWEEVVYPRARVRAALRRAEHHARRFPTATAAALALTVGVPFFMYMQAGGFRGFAAWGVFVGTTLFLALGGPLLLIFAWPAAVVGGVAGCLWLHFGMGEGAVWLGVATASALLVFYFATTEIAPMAAAAAAAWAASDLGTGVAVACFLVVAATTLTFRYRVTGPLVCAGWVLLSGAAAAHAAAAVLGSRMPQLWMRGPLPGPYGTSLWACALAIVAALLVVPKKRRAPRKIRSLAEQLPP